MDLKGEQQDPGEMALPFLIVGAGLSGATLARALAEQGHAVHVIDQRDHVAGNCHTDIDAETGVLVHRYGPHIFHTDNDRIWNFLSRFTEFVPYRHRVIASARGQMYRLPINLHTLCQFFGRSFTPKEAEAHLRACALPIDEPRSFEEQALATVGRAIYETFFEGYTRKQWGCDPAELPASVLKRLPVRFSFDDNYFHHVRQAMPRHGYTEMTRAMLDHPEIALTLGRRYEDAFRLPRRHVFHSGPIDRFFGQRFGPLAYRSLRFEEVRGEGDLQGTPVINHCDPDVPYTRTTEHKWLSPWRPTGNGSVLFRETSHAAGPDDILYYPIGMTENKARLARYEALAAATPGLTFFGRLGSYAYLDMDAAVGRALDLADEVRASLGAGEDRFAGRADG
jgi:UDP-galactopyranose mutase